LGVHPDYITEKVIFPIIKALESNLLRASYQRKFAAGTLADSDAVSKGLTGFIVMV
jgi:hypothetical protein